MRATSINVNLPEPYINRARLFASVRSLPSHLTLSLSLRHTEPAKPATSLSFYNCFPIRDAAAATFAWSRLCICILRRSQFIISQYAQNERTNGAMRASGINYNRFRESIESRAMATQRNCGTQNGMQHNILQYTNVHVNMSASVVHAKGACSQARI